MGYCDGIRYINIKVKTNEFHRINMFHGSQAITDGNINMVCSFQVWAVGVVQ